MMTNGTKGTMPVRGALELSATWALFEAGGIFCALLEVYLFVCVTLFARRRLQYGPAKNPKVKRLKSNKIATIETRGQRNVLTTTSRPVKSKITFKRFWNEPGKWLQIWLFLSIIFAILRTISGQSVIVVGDWSDFTCNMISKITVVLTGSSLETVYAFLWCRQTSLYSTPQAACLRPAWLKTLSQIWLVYNVITYVAGTLLHLWWRDFAVQTHGCAPAVDSFKTDTYIPFLVLAIITAISQLLLTFLFVYPMLFSRRGDRRREVDGQKHITVFLDVARRATIGCVVGISTDIFGACVATFLPQDFPVANRVTTYQLNISFNIVCLLYTYSDWRDIVFPWKYHKQLSAGSNTDRE